MGIIGNNISNIYVGDYPDAGVFGASYLLFIFAWTLVVQVCLRWSFLGFLTFSPDLPVPYFVGHMLYYTDLDLVLSAGY